MAVPTARWSCESGGIERDAFERIGSRDAYAALTEALAAPPVH
ncbi:hypothetical protein [Elioraea sp.]